jgi:hypothetical protein
MNYVTESEIDGDVKPKTISTTNRFIRCIRSIFRINLFTKGKHAPKSYHYVGMALDGQIGKFDSSRQPTAFDEAKLLCELMKIISKPEKSIFEQAIVARLSGFAGVGIYPDWNPKAGLHLDIRETPIAWIGLNKEKLQELIDKTSTEQVYIYLT